MLTNITDMKKLLFCFTLVLTVCNMSMADGQPATPPNNEIWYTSSDGQPIEPTDKTVFGATYESSTYNNGKGIITFDIAVSTIGQGAFASCSTLTSIEIPESLTSIGYAAFGGCKALTSIEIPESVESIGDKAFCDCSGLKSVFVAWTDADKIPSLTSGSFPYETCYLYVPEGTTDIYSGKNYWKMFKSINVHIPFNQIWYTSSDAQPITPTYTEEMLFGAKYLSSTYNGGKGIITFDGDISTIGELAFFDCSNLTSIRMPESVTSIGKTAFLSCSGLESIGLPNSLQSIGEDAFKSCAKLASIEIPDSVASIGKSVFESCSNLVSIKLPESVTSIGESAFDGCSSLTGIMLPESLESIGSSAFYKCSSLTSIKFPESLKSIGELAFCETGLTSVFVEWTDAYDIPDLKEIQFPYERCDLYIPYGTKKLYGEKKYWESFNSIIEPHLHIVNTDNTVEDRYLKDGEALALSDDIKQIVTQGTVSDINLTYTRDFTNADKWQGWYVPFDVSVADMAQAELEVAEIYGILLDNSGNTVLAFLKMNAGTVKANTPYVVRPKESGKVTLTTSNTTIRPSEDTKFTIDSAEDTYTIGGIYEQTQTPGNWYAINKDGRFQKMGEGVGLRPFRVWMTIGSREDNPYATKSGMNMMVISKGQIYTVNGKNYLAQ